MSRRYKWIHHNGTTFYNVGITPDGLLHNPNHYPDDDVQDAIKFVEALRLERRKRAAKKAAETGAAPGGKRKSTRLSRSCRHTIPLGPEPTAPFADDTSTIRNQSIAALAQSVGRP